MAKFEKHFQGDFDAILEFCNKTIFNESVSTTLEDSSDFQHSQTRVAIRVFERYSAFGGNRVSLNLSLVGIDNNLFLSAITSGGSQAMLFKLNTVGEETFLETLVPALEEYLSQEK